MSDTSKTAVARALEGCERRFSGSRVEFGCIVDTDGAVLEFSEGDANSVSIDSAKASGKIVTHYHPLITSFSEQDIRVACRRSVQEMRAVDDEYIYSMKPPAQGWDYAFWEQRVQPVFNEVEGVIFGDLLDRLQIGEITEDDLKRSLYHLIWTEVAQRTGIKDERISRS